MIEFYFYLSALNRELNKSLIHNDLPLEAKCFKIEKCRLYDYLILSDFTPVNRKIKQGLF